MVLFASPAGVAVVSVVVVDVALVSAAGVVVAFVSVVVVVVLLSLVVPPPPQAATDATKARLASDKAIVLNVISLIRLLLRLLVCWFYRFFSICQDATCNKSHPHETAAIIQTFCMGANLLA